MNDTIDLEPKDYESNNWKQIRLNIGWIMLDKIDPTVYRIKVFDDGNQDLMSYENEWQIYGSFKGKVCLCNVKNKNILVFSISYWKIEKL